MLTLTCIILAGVCVVLFMGIYAASRIIHDLRQESEITSEEYRRLQIRKDFILSLYGMAIKDRMEAKQKIEDLRKVMEVMS